MSVLPTPHQQTLLQGALFQTRDALAQAEAWLDAHPSFETIDLASHRLLPLLYSNLRGRAAPHLLTRLRPIQRYYWAENQKLFHHLAQALQWFHANGIPTIVLKGAALTVLHYRDMAARPMSDYDVLIPEDAAATTVRALIAGGWQPRFVPLNAFDSAYYLRCRHAVSLQHPTLGEMDVHWHALWAATYPGADRCLWDASVPVAINSIATRALGPTDQLLHSIVHGIVLPDFSPIRWIADAVKIVHTSEIDWTRLIQLSKQFQVTAPVGFLLAFLQNHFLPIIPNHVVAELQSMPVASAARRYFENLQTNEHIALRLRLLDMLEGHRRVTPDLNAVARLSSFPRRIQFEFYRSSLPDLALYALSGVLRSIGRTFSSKA
jgi:hypothetical protein